MPDRDVKTIRDLIFFQYAKIIACSAFKCANGKEAKKKSYGFIKKTFRDLQSGRKNWSDILREDLQFVEREKTCVYCGSTENIEREHIVPKSLKINERCPACDKIQGIHNMIWACKHCNTSKNDRGLYTFYKELKAPEPKFYDLLDPLAEKKYLKTIYDCHACAGTLDAADLDGDGVMTVLDLDFILK